MGTSTRWWAGLGLALLFGLALRYVLAHSTPRAASVPTAAPMSAVESAPGRRELESAEIPSAESRTPSATPSSTETKASETETATHGVVLGRVVVPEGRAQDVVDLHLVPETPGTRLAHEFAWLEGGAFRFGQLADGAYRLDLNLFGNLAGTHSVRGLAVRAGETLTLEPIELAQLLHVVRLEVYDENGASVPGATIWLPGLGAVGWWQVRTPRDQDGALLLQTFESPPERLRVGAPGFLTVELENPLANERVVLVRGPNVELRLHGQPPLPKSWHLLAHLVQDEAWEPDAPTAFDALGRATVRLTRSGSFNVTLALQQADEIGNHGLEGLGWVIAVEASPSEQVFTSPPFTAEFLDNIARLTGSAR